MFTKFSTFFICLFAFSMLVQAAPGDFDLSFGDGGKVVSPIGKNSYDRSFASALQPDGKIIVAGDSVSDDEFNSEEPAHLLVSRINADGSFDTSFGAGGKVIKKFPWSSRALSIVVQTDGKILVGGTVFVSEQNSFRNYFLLVRFNANGSLDNSFGTGGVVQTTFGTSGNSVLYSLALQSDGKIAAVGSFTGAGGMPIARYNPNGSLDTTFDGDGKLLINFGNIGSTRAESVAVQTDGRIVVGGYASFNSLNLFALARLNSDGSFDNNFDGDGKLTTAFGTSNSFLREIKIQSDGKILAAGSAFDFSVANIAAARYNNNGSLDASFDADGILIIDLGGHDLTNALDVQPDGKIIFAGNSYNSNVSQSPDFFSVRCHPDGSPDNSYDGDGRAVTMIPQSADTATAAFVQPDGKILVSGYSQSLDVNVTLVRHNADGSLDAAFDGDGIVSLEFANSADYIYETALQPDGKIVAAGSSFGGLFHRGTIARYHSNGSLDTAFGEQGSIVVPINDSGSSISDIAVQPQDGKIVVSVNVYGEFTNRKYTVIRYNPNGTLDDSFAAGGVFILSGSPLEEYSRSLLLQPDGKIVAAGQSSGGSSSNSGISLIRLNADGTLDTTFGSGGKVLTITPNHSDGINSAALQADGKIVVAGQRSVNLSNTYAFLVSRYNADGSLDATFGGSGIVYTLFNNQDFAYAVAIQPDGKIVLAGNSSYTKYALARYNPDGSLDNSFDGDGKVLIDPQTGTFNTINDVAVQSNGKIVAAGVAQNNSRYDAAVLRLKTDGSLDGSFGGGRIVTSIGSGNSLYSSVLLQPDGKIVASGHSNNGFNNDFTLVRYQGGEAANRTRFDFDGDGKADVSVFRPSNGAWYLQNSLTGFSGEQFGTSTDKIVPADYDGDGKTDLAVYRGGTWYLQRNQLGFTGVTFGAVDDIPVPADYDGDGKSDLAVFRPSNGIWYLLQSTLGFTGIAFGQTGDKPVAADYDGDNKADVAVFRSGTWYIQRSALGFTGIAFGDAADKPVAADYDGDGKADVAVFRPSNGVWYLQRSGLGFAGIAFGDAADLPVAADYDGDGKTDVAVFRPSNSVWYLQRSQSGFTGIAFGAGDDKPIPNAFVP